MSYGRYVREVKKKHCSDPAELTLLRKELTCAILSKDEKSIIKAEKKLGEYLLKQKKRL